MRRSLLGDKRVLLWTDSIATRAYVNTGAGSSRVMTGIMKRKDVTNGKLWDSLHS